MSNNVILANDCHNNGPFPYTTIINQRETQQDALLSTRWVHAVADGMGGHANGAEAAIAALEVLAERITGPVTKKQFQEVIDEANRAVCDLADGGYRAPGTTLVAVAIQDDNTVLGAWVGDSRIYAVSENGGIECATTDHAGPFGGLYRCLGEHGNDAIGEPEFFTVDGGKQTRLLLCSDGVSGPVDRNERLELDVLLVDGIDTLVRECAQVGSDNATGLLVNVDQFLGG